MSDEVYHNLIDAFCRNLRRESSQSSKWHSMDNLHYAPLAKATLKAQLQQQHLLHTPARGRKTSNAGANNSSQQQQAMGTPKKPSRRKAASPTELQPSQRSVGFR